MMEILRTNDPVELSWAQAILADENIESFVFDYHTSLIEGSIGALPRRLMVADEDATRAQWRLKTEREALEAYSDDE